MTIIRTISNPNTLETDESSVSLELTMAIPLTDAELEKAYREREMQYRIEDAKRHCDELGHTNFDDIDFKILAEHFLSKTDCNTAENDTWESVIKKYVGKEV